ncbi:MAG TPA: PEP-CTERM sorting domain-containing protein [Cyanobacteria bacterium UBA11691]|nr:PEP-CTERM sorting domain-containing protein [Cyanobacteria bacterium UBA11691]
MNSTVKAIALGAATTVAGIFSLTTSASAFNFSGPAPTINPDTENPEFHQQFQVYFQEERVRLEGADLNEFDPSNLFLKYDHDVTVHFINEGAQFRNQLSYQSTGATNSDGLVFDDISSAEAVGNWGGDALDLGDWVSLGTIAGGSNLDFALRADGYCRDNQETCNYLGYDATYYTDSSLNPTSSTTGEGLQQVVSYVLDQRYIIMGWEDINGNWADNDFNDVLFVVDIGEANARSLVGVPEPSSVLGLLALGAVAGLVNRRRNA